MTYLTGGLFKWNSKTISYLKSQCFFSNNEWSENCKHLINKFWNEFFPKFVNKFSKQKVNKFLEDVSYCNLLKNIWSHDSIVFVIVLLNLNHMSLVNKILEWPKQWNGFFAKFKKYVRISRVCATKFSCVLLIYPKYIFLFEFDHITCY